MMKGAHTAVGGALVLVASSTFVNAQDVWETAFGRVVGSGAVSEEIPQVAVLSGRVLRDSSGEPIGDATIVVRDPVTNASRERTIGENGEFEIRPLAAGRELQFELRRDSWLPLPLRLDPLEVGRNERTIRVEPAVLVRVRAVELDTNRPLAGVRLVIRYGKTMMSTRSDVDGSFILHCADVGLLTSEGAPTVIIVETHPTTGFGTLTRIPIANGPSDRAWPVFVGRGCDVQGQLSTVRGRLVESVGSVALAEGVADDTFSMVNDGAERSCLVDPESIQNVGPRGRFEFRSIPPRLRREVVARLDSGVILRTPLPDLLSDGASAEMKIVVPVSPGRLAFEVRHAGAPVEATVSWNGQFVSGSMAVGSDGAGQVGGLPVGRLLVRAEYQVGLAATRVARELEIKEGVADPLVLEIRDDSMIRGTVTDDSGNPVAGVRVFRKSMNDPQTSLRYFIDGKREWITSVVAESTSTDASGEFRFESIEPGSAWLIGVDDPRFSDADTDAAAGSDAVELIARRR